MGYNIMEGNNESMWDQVDDEFALTAASETRSCRCKYFGLDAAKSACIWFCSFLAPSGVITRQIGCPTARERQLGDSPRTTSNSACFHGSFCDDGIARRAGKRRH